MLILVSSKKYISVSSEFEPVKNENLNKGVIFMLNLENKTFVIMGIANKRSIGFGVAKVLDQLGAKLVFTYRKDRSKKN